MNEFKEKILVFYIFNLFSCIKNNYYLPVTFFGLSSCLYIKLLTSLTNSSPLYIICFNILCLQNKFLLFYFFLVYLGFRNFNDFDISEKIEQLISSRLKKNNKTLNQKFSYILKCCCKLVSPQKSTSPWRNV